MHGPAPAGWLLVALCAVSGAYCLLRTRSSVAGQRRSAGADAVMGFGMAAMALPASVPSPPTEVWYGCAVLFCALALRALPAARGDPHRLHHLAGSGAMVHMALVMAAMPPGHAARMTSGATAAPLVSGALLLYFAGHALVAGVRLVPAAPAQAGHPAAADGPAGGTGWRDRPELAHACRLSMSLAMVAMLPAL